MSDNTKIEWADSTANYINGCTVLSPGCTNCYAMKLAGTRMRNHPTREGLTDQTKAGPVWNGQVRAHEPVLQQVLRWKRPRAIFWNAHGDTFHEKVPDEWIDRMFAVMALTPQHRHMVLTKRSDRMREYVDDPETPFRVARAMIAISGQPDGSEQVCPIEGFPGYFVSSHGHVYSERRGKRKRLKPDVGEQGHQRVPLFREGGPRHGERMLVHRIVLTAFVGAPPTDDAQGRHLDGNPANNALGNLTWGDQSANWDDSRRHGSFRRYSKLDTSQVEQIRARGAKGEAAYSIAKDFPVSDTQIRNILNGDQWAIDAPIAWPLANVWKGVSVEDQQRTDERIPDLLATPAAVRFLSCEPLLGPLDIRAYLPDCYECGLTCGLRLPDPPDQERCTECGWFGDPETEPVISEGCPDCGGELEYVCPNCGHYMVYQHPDTPNLDWVIVGGESGPKARPMHPDWARSLRDQCAAAGVAFHFKQNGEYLDLDHLGMVWNDLPDRVRGNQQFVDGKAMIRVGKKRAGRVLDGIEHNGVPA